MTSKPHPHRCFGAQTAEDCCCEFQPHPNPVPAATDFISQHNPYFDGSRRRIPIKYIPTFTERRQCYEDLKAVNTGTQTATSTGAIDSEDIGLPFTDTQLVQLKLFREENMKECMSTMNQHLYKRFKAFSLEPSKHRCQHRFRINERNLLVAKNKNQSGQSVCEECGTVSESLDGRRAWNRGDICSNSHGAPLIVITEDNVPEQNVKTNCKSKKPSLPFKSNLRGNKEPTKLKVHFAKRLTELPFSSALIYQKVE